MIRQLETGNILTAVASCPPKRAVRRRMAKVVGIGNTSTLATFNKCFGFTKMDAGSVVRIKKVAYGVTVKS